MRDDNKLLKHLQDEAKAWRCKGVKFVSISWGLYGLMFAILILVSLLGD